MNSGPASDFSAAGPWNEDDKTLLKIELQRQLNLAWVEDGPGRAIKRIWRALAEAGRRCRAAKCRRIERAKIRGAVNRIKEAYVQSIPEVKRFGDELEAALFLESELACKAHVNRAEIIADKGIPRLDARAVVVAEDVAIRVKPGKLRKTLRRLIVTVQSPQRLSKDAGFGAIRGHRGTLRKTVGSLNGHDQPPQETPPEDVPGV